MSNNPPEQLPERQEDLPTIKAPDFWVAAQQSIIGIPVQEPTFVASKSILENPDTHELVIDRKDGVPGESDWNFTGQNPSIGVIRIVDGPIDGMVADLRYTVRMTQRQPMDDPFEDNDRNEGLLTQPLYGALFADWVESKEVFLCQAGGYVGEDILNTLKTFVDEERAKRGLPVFGDALDAKHADEPSVYGEVSAPTTGRRVREDMESGFRSNND